MTTHLIDLPNSGVPVITKCCTKKAMEIPVGDSLTRGASANCGAAAAHTLDGPA